MKRALRQAGVPLAFYYAVTLALPIANGAATEPRFLEHALVVFVVPLALVAIFGLVRPIGLRVAHVVAKGHAREPWYKSPSWRDGNS